MEELQKFDLDELIHFYCKSNALENNLEALKGVIGSMLEDKPNKEIVVWFPELWDAVEASNLNIEEVECMCCGEEGMRFYLDFEN